jgi:hypothetical protein
VTFDPTAFSSSSFAADISAAAEGCLGESEWPLEFAAELASLAEPLAGNHFELGLLVAAFSIVAGGSARQKGLDDPTVQIADRVSRRLTGPPRR